MPANEEDVKLLKIMVAAAKKNPVNIGICMGKKADKMVVVMDRKRPADALGRAAKKDGETAKVGVGTVTIEGRNATLKCDGKPPSGLAKQLKEYFKLIELPLVFVLLDEAGAEIGEEQENENDAEENGETQNDAGQEQEQEVEDPARIAWDAAWTAAGPKIADAIRANPKLADKLRAVRDFAQGKGDDGEYAAAQRSLQTLMGLIPSAATPAAEDVEQNPPVTQQTPGINPKDIVEQLKAVKTRIAALQGDAVGRLNDSYIMAVNLLKSNDLERAAEAAENLTAAVTQAESAAPQNAPDPRLAKVSDAAGKLRNLVNALPGSDGRQAMLDLLDGVGGNIEKGEPEVALGAMKRVQDGLKLQAEVDHLSPLVAAAASSGKVADVNALNLLFNMVADAVPAPDHAKAMANLVRVEAMITAGAEGSSTFEKEIPVEVQPFAMSRIEWGKTRGKMREQLEVLQDAIVKACEAAGGLKSVSDGVGRLLDHVMKLDERLEDKLDQIVNAETGDQREALKREARALLAEYSGELGKPFFADVDSRNGFTNVAVASTARASLAEISNVLAA